jgi:hypothetical protein
MSIMRTALSLALPLAMLTSCGGGGGGSSGGAGSPVTGDMGTGPGVLSASPLALSSVISVTPLGKMAPPGHVLPTDHIYISFVDPMGNGQTADCSKRPVYAPGAGTVTFILVTETRGDTKVMVQMTKTFFYYLDHILQTPNIVIGTKVKAGEQIGTTTGFCPSIDLGVYDLDVSPPGFVNPSRYGDLGAHPAAPLKYFSEPIRTAYYDRVRVEAGVPDDKDGRVDYGVRGRLAGDWFHASLATAPASVINGPDGWIKTIAFARDWYKGAWRISIGGVIASPGVLSLAAGNPDPATVSTASGIVAFEGAPVIGTIGGGWVLAQMLSDERIKIEFFSGAAARPAGFTGAAQEYVR